MIDGKDEKMTFGDYCRLIAAKKGIPPDQVEKETLEAIMKMLTPDFVIGKKNG